MMFKKYCALSTFLCLLTLVRAFADPQLSSWFTEPSGRYAKIYATDADKDAGKTITSWTHPDGGAGQVLPTYAGVHEVAYTASTVYVRATGLGYHVMGPWYTNDARDAIVFNYPANIADIFHFPRTPVIPATKTILNGLAVGCYVDGVTMFDTRDLFSYDNGRGFDSPPFGGDPGDGIWNRNATLAEAATFDNSNGHQADDTYHVHSLPLGLRHLLGDSVDYDSTTNTYTENFNGKHSPILGWVGDGIPLYGPYGYSDPLDSASAVRRMVTGYQPRDGSNGSSNLAVTGRTTLPAWIVRNKAEFSSSTLAANQYGPAVSVEYYLERYLEDNAYKGDLGFTQGTEFDMSEYNTRWCVTPEFPGGTWAYFTCIEADGTPQFPYNLCLFYFGTPPVAGGFGSPVVVDEVPVEAVTYFEGGPERPVKVKSISADESSGDVVISWTAAAGGSYAVESSSDAAIWTDIPVVVQSESEIASLTDGARADSDASAYYKPRMTSLAAFDDTGFVYDDSIVQSPLDSVTALLSSGGGTQPPVNLNILPTSITINGQAVTILSRPSQYIVELGLDLASLVDGTYTIVATFPDGGVWTGTFDHVGSPNVLLLIVDDWGVDSSPLDNSSVQNPGTSFASMANLEALAANGLRFTNAYAQPTCSPTRAALMTGRHAFRTGIGNAGDVLSDSETTLPEAFTAASSPYQLASYGKWHLGGGDTGYSTLGGWPEFVGITGGGVANQADGYENWPRNNNGVSANSTVYTTTDQVNSAKAFIEAKDAVSQPWFVWMGFNAPHTPFHEPPSGLLQGATGTSDKDLYQKALEALDTEIGRLLQSVDLSKTNIILVGDNGTPAQVVQDPFGPIGNAGKSKGDLYEGGIHVPMVVRGPSVKLPAGSTTDKLVHVVDLYSTILELANIPVPEVAVDTTSILPVLAGNDTAERCVVTESFGIDIFGEPGRSFRLGAWPDYKLIIIDDPLDAGDTPVHNFFDLSTDQNEDSPIDIASLTGDALIAYNAMIAKDTALGSAAPEATLYIEIETGSGAGSVPASLAANPTGITVDGVTATYISRVDSSETAQRYWVKCTVPQAALYTAAVVTFTNNPNTGAPRVFDSVQIITSP